MNISILSGNPLRAFRALAFLAVSTSLAAACGGGAQQAMPFAPSVGPSSVMPLAIDGSDAAVLADASGALGEKGKGGDKGSDHGKDKRGNSDDAATPDAARVEIEGAITSVTAAACPAVTFVVGGKTIVTDAATTYDDGVCADIVKDAKVEVHGATQANGSVLARDVEFAEADEDDDAEEDDTEDDDADSDDADDHSGRNPHDGPGPFEGTVSSFRGPCPAVTFNLKGMRIVATSATTFTGGTCETLRPNVKVVVTGTHGTGRRVFNATAITITRTPTTS